MVIGGSEYFYYTFDIEIYAFFVAFFFAIELDEKVKISYPIGYTGA